jgi:hypothetical protein
MSDHDLWEEASLRAYNSDVEVLPSIEDFFTQEFQWIDHNIEQLTTLINRSYLPDDPLGNGERALLTVQRHHRSIIEAIAAASDDFATALALCHTRLKTLETTHHRLAQNNHAVQLLHSDQWWDMVDELDYLLDLVTRIKKYHSASRIRKIV